VSPDARPGVFLVSADLKDFRGKITIETHCVLEAENRVTGEDKSVIARQVLHEWAVQKLQVAKVTDALLRSEGMPGIADGVAGNRGEGGGK
jgi:hypothetical protein